MSLPFYSFVAHVSNVVSSVSFRVGEYFLLLLFGFNFVAIVSAALYIVEITSINEMVNSSVTASPVDRLCVRVY